nr:ATP-binding protein [Mesorhizobium loti]
MLSISAVTLSALAIMFFGSIFYYYNYEWLVPAGIQGEESDWVFTDFVALAIFVAISLIAAGIVGWRLARRILRPLDAVAKALRSITMGNFSARAEVVKNGFGEAETLISDFNAMARRLETAESELRFSNSAIAHELRTPLTILRGRLQGLSDGVFPPTKELYGNLIAHVDGLTLLVEDLRTLGLASAGHLDLKPEVVNLASEVAAIAGAMEPEMAAADVKLEWNLQAARCEIDRNRVRQALLAVLDNARRYAPHSTVCMQTFVSGSVGVIRCSDSGPGVPPESHDKVFERFWRADESRSRKSGGSGLGLAVVRAIVRAHGGDTTARSSPSGGLIIEISLPLFNPPAHGMDEEPAAR